MINSKHINFSFVLCCCACKTTRINLHLVTKDSTIAAEWPTGYHFWLLIRKNDWHRLAPDMLCFAPINFNVSFGSMQILIITAAVPGESSASQTNPRQALHWRKCFGANPGNCMPGFKFSYVGIICNQQFQIVASPSHGVIGLPSQQVFPPIWPLLVRCCIESDQEPEQLAPPGVTKNQC